MHPTYPDLAGKVVVVTGGSRGIGAATCRLFAENGAKVAVNGRDRKAIDAVVEQIVGSGGQALGVPADCTDFSAIEDMRRRVEGELGPVDVLAIFAGGPGRTGPTAQIVEDQWRSIIDSNLTATFLTVKSFLPGMTDRRCGSIITMSSSAARLPGATTSAAYAAAKAGIAMLTRHVANEVAKSGVRVNCLAPSVVLSERIERVMPEAARQQFAATLPLGRLGFPDDVAHAALFLASDSSSWMTGVTLDVAGGRVMM